MENEQVMEFVMNEYKAMKHPVFQQKKHEQLLIHI